MRNDEMQTEEDAHIEETAVFIAASLEQFEKAMDLIPPEDKAEYETARQIAPHLFECELNAIGFLRYNNFNPWAAARRMANYWKYRKQFFRDRWLMPLALSSHYGALYQVDIDLLRTGYVVVHDECMVLDFERILKFVFETTYSEQDIEDARVRLQFYIMTLCFDENSQRHGKKVLVPIAGTTFGKSWKIVDKIWPSKKLFLTGSYMVLFKQRMKDSFYCFVVRFFERVCRHVFKKEPVFITASSKEEMLLKILEVGFPLHVIPEKLGGPWRDADTQKWFDDLTRRDDERNSRILLRRKGANQSPTVALNWVDYRKL